MPLVQRQEHLAYDNPNAILAVRIHTIKLKIITLYKQLIIY
ncbi:hypothetical protein THOB06_170037 [Vibrio rotiferianus]|nr:hypothetical protein THOG10_170038 [Vibrio rotiferianus]CAH1568692.1 hypothetical protein THOB06_170037 [Vibrio rotiferianus]